MADSIVSCPSCGKQYRIRDESKSSTFICTACGGEVSAGPAPAKARPAQARPADSRPAGGRPGKARKARAATGAPAGGLKRTRGASERPQRRQREGAPPPKQNTWLYVGLGGLVVVVLAVIVVVVMMSDDDPVKPPNVAGNGNGSADLDAPPPTDGTDAPPPTSTRPEALRETPEEDIVLPEPMDAPEEKPEAKPDQVEKVDRTVDENETDPYKMQKVTLRSKSYSWYVENDHFKHLDDTASDLRQEIDKLCATIVDFNAGADGVDAQSRLAEIGKPAIPRILLAFSKAGDLGDREGMINACFVDETLWKICGGHARTDELKAFAQPTKSTIMKTAKYWCAWWFTAGHKMDVFIEDEPEEDEE